MGRQIKNLVTGGCGFLGSNLIRYLLNKNEEVICLDNYSSGKKSNILNHLTNKRLEVINHDITKPISFKVDRIWHLACPASPIYYQFDPIQTAVTNFQGTHNMLSLAKEIGAQFLLASTSEVYGDPDIHPQNELYKGSVSPTGVRACYEEGKRIAETLCTDFRRMHNTDIKIIRIFNTYGPYMRFDDGRVISNFIVQSLQNKKLTIYGDGSQIRSFCFVDDLIEGMHNLMESNFNKPINLGNPYEISIKKLAILIRDLINPELDFTYKKLPDDDPKQRCPSIKLAKEILNWVPKTNLKDGLIKTIDWYKREFKEMNKIC